jgi:DNA-binding CsgD family transcriptional regulator
MPPSSSSAAEARRSPLAGVLLPSPDTVPSRASSSSVARRGGTPPTRAPGPAGRHDRFRLLTPSGAYEGLHSSALDEIRSVREAIGAPAQPYIALWVAAMRGRETETLDLIRAASHEAAARGEGYVTFVTEHVTAVLYNGLGRYSEVLAALRRQAVDPSYRDGSPRPMAELVEAAVRSGERQLAGLALGRLAETTIAAGTDWALGIEARSRALLSDGEAAEDLYRDAIERLSRTSIRVQLALPTSSTANGSDASAAAARPASSCARRSRCSRAWGPRGSPTAPSASCRRPDERARKRSVETREDLTPQETQIARPAGDGLSNAEIGARLFVSQSTVAYHLRNVFSKLKIASRHQLRQVVPLGSNAQPTPPGTQPTGYLVSQDLLRRRLGQLSLAAALSLEVGRSRGALGFS